MLEQRPEQVRINRKQPITIDDIRRMHFQEGIIGIRDKALLLTGFATGMRRSELAALKKDDILATEFGYRITRDPVGVHDLQATILHLMGFDHEQLTYPYQGRDFRLTDVHGNVVKDLLA